MLDVYDMIYLRRYLSGLSGPTNLDDYDINSNGLITPFDTWVLEAHLNGILPANVDDNYTENAVSSAVSSRYYWKHDCNSNVGSSHTVYKIDRPITAYGNTSVSNNVSNESFSSINSIPSTDYVKLDDNQAVVFLKDHGTGFIISDHIIVTAAHCVYSRDEHDSSKIWFNDIDITIKDADSDDIKTIKPKSIHIPAEYAESVEYLATHDYALLYVEEDLSEYGRFYLSVPLKKYLDGDSYTLQAKIIGFPKCIDLFTYGTRVRSDGQIKPGVYDNYNIWFKAYAAGGMSGGPVYLNESYAYLQNGSYVDIDYNSVFAIFTGNGEVDNSRALRINEDILAFYYNNPNLT